MTENHKRSRVASDPELYERIKTIVARYPETTPAENSKILVFLRKGPMLDRALLSGVPELQPQLARFEADHRKELSLGPRHYLLVAFVFLALLLVGYLLWDIAL